MRYFLSFLGKYQVRNKTKLMGVSFLLMMLFIGTLSQAAVIWLGDTKLPAYSYDGYLTKPHSKGVLSVIEQMPWIEEPALNGSQKYIYIFYFPECPASQELYEESREFLGKVNIRWIPVVRERYAGLLETRTPEALKDAFEKDIAPKIENIQLTNHKLHLTITAYRFLISMGLLSSDKGGHVPTIVYGDSNRLNISINPFFEDVIPYTPNTHAVQNPFILELAARDEPHINLVKEKTIYQVEKGKSVKVYLTAHENSLVLGMISNELSPFEIAGTTDNGFIVIDISGDGHYVYLKNIESLTAVDPKSIEQ